MSTLNFDIKKLLARSYIKWPGDAEELRKDFENIIDLIKSLPEPKAKEISYTQFAVLDEDVADHLEEKSIINRGDMFKI